MKHGRVWKQTAGGTMPGKALANPPEKCDVCHKPFFCVLYDAKTRLRGRWAWLCTACFEKFGIGLGIGLGQRYQLKEEPDSPPSAASEDAG